MHDTAEQIGDGEPSDSETPGSEPRRFSEHSRMARHELEAKFTHARAGIEGANERLKEANERIKQRTGRDLIVATLIGVAIGAAVLACLLFVKWIFIFFALGASSLAIFELSRALNAAGRRVDIVPQLIAGAVLVAVGYFASPDLHWIALVAAVAFLVVWRLVAQMIARDSRPYSAVLSDVLIGSFVHLYIAFFASLAMALLAQDGGEWWVAAFITIAVAADTGAYVTGLTLGRHPMAPRISPKKTWEGFAGAVVVALTVGVLIAIFALGLPFWAGLIIGAAITATATVGDLGESMMKRDLGIKDMSSWLPGHGGVLDRLDSILPSSLAALVLYQLLTPLANS